MLRQCVVIRNLEDKPLFVLDIYGTPQIAPDLVSTALRRRGIDPASVRFMPLDFYVPRQSYRDTYPTILPPLRYGWEEEPKPKRVNGEGILARLWSL